MGASQPYLSFRPTWLLSITGRKARYGTLAYLSVPCAFHCTSQQARDQAMTSRTRRRVLTTTALVKAQRANGTKRWLKRCDERSIREQEKIQSIRDPCCWLTERVPDRERNTLKRTRRSDQGLMAAALTACSVKKCYLQLPITCSCSTVN